MWVADFPDDPELISAAQSNRRCGPLAHAVHREYQRLLERRREKCAGGVALVMLREKQAAGPATARPNRFQFPAKQVFLEQLLANPQRERHAERPQPARREREIVLQKPLEFKKRLFVENNVLQVRRLQACRFQTISHGVARETGRRASCG